MNKKARTVFNTIQQTFTSRHQLESFNPLLAAFLDADGKPRPEHAPLKNTNTFQRFLNHYDWNARAIIRAVKAAILTQLVAVYGNRKGRRPILEIIVDLTSLEKPGSFEKLEIHQLNHSAPRACGVHPPSRRGRRPACT